MPSETIRVFIELRNLSKNFVEGSGTRLVLNQVNATFNQGEFIVLLGQSGSGKSTLLNLLSGIEKPTTGQVLINGVAVNEMSERDCTLFRRDRIGFVFQFFNLIPTLTVLENVTLPQELAGKEIKELEDMALKLLREVGLAERCQTFPDQLSGGQQQRVAIARALIHNPMLILADEPTGNLDEETGDCVLKLLLELTRNVNKTLIMATHNPEIAKMADRVLRVHEGTLQENCSEKLTPTY
ncbi:MAG: ABC transporter ATP-binding protein [Symploca sp. SIO2C1]|nr:ABC transporter ATP-binding protein [Symploca sp. SIO2C1]